MKPTAWFEHSIFINFCLLARGPSSPLYTIACDVDLIRESQARIVFLCKPRAEEAVHDSSMVSFALELREFKYRIYIVRAHSASGITLRLVIRFPPMQSQVWSSTKADSSMFSEGLRLIIINMLRLEGIRGYSIETIARAILSWAKREKSGNTSVEIDTMSFRFNFGYLARGLEKRPRKIPQLMRGSLPRGLMMVLGSLERRPCKRKEGEEGEESDCSICFWQLKLMRGGWEWEARPCLQFWSLLGASGKTSGC